MPATGAREEQTQVCTELSRGSLLTVRLGKTAGVHGRRVLGDGNVHVADAGQPDGHHGRRHHRSVRRDQLCAGELLSVR